MGGITYTPSIAFEIPAETEQGAISDVVQESKLGGKVTLWESSGGGGGEKALVQGGSVFAEVDKKAMIIENSQLFIQTSVGKERVRILPNEAVALSAEAKIDSIEKIELKENAQKPVYSVKGSREAKLFALIPVSLKIETEVNAQSGAVLAIKKPWWSFLAQ